MEMYWSSHYQQPHYLGLLTGELRAASWLAKRGLLGLCTCLPLAEFLSVDVSYFLLERHSLSSDTISVCASDGIEKEGLNRFS